MGNKDAGRALRSMDMEDYVEVMGGSSTNYKNTGINFPNNQVWRYFKLLRDYALNRIQWRSNKVDERELRLIEWNIFHYGFCAMVQPTITRNGIKMKTDKLKIFQCVLVDPNPRNGRAGSINIVNNYQSRIPIDITYGPEDFVIFTDEFAFPNSGLPFVNLAWEYANKLYEVDLVFDSVAGKMRAPIVYNGGSDTTPENSYNLPNNPGSQTVADIMKAAYDRRAKHVVLTENQVGRDGLIYPPPDVPTTLAELIDAQDRLYEAYFKTLGLYTNKDKTGSYTVKELQEEGDETGDFRTEVWKSNRLICAKEAALKFDIDLELKVM